MNEEKEPAKILEPEKGETSPDFKKFVRDHAAKNGLRVVVVEEVVKHEQE